MAYSDFTIKKLKEEFGIVEQQEYLNLNQQKIESSGGLKQTLEMTRQCIPIRTKKARSEFIVNPVLMDLLKYNAPFLTIHSGDDLDVDEKRGLEGECDFILSKNLNTIEISLPIIIVVGAKNHDMDLGIPYCVAQMLGARIYNEQDKQKVEPIYGCVTTGEEWKFMKLEKHTIYADKKTYYLGELEELLGAFQTIIDYYKEHLN